MTAVRLTHTPTGERVYAYAARTVAENRDAAYTALCERLGYAPPIDELRLDVYRSYA